MLTFPHAFKIYLAVEPVDMRAQSNGLWAHAEQKLREDPRSGALSAFAHKDRNRVKLLYWDGTGVWLFAKRHEKGRFSWPVGHDATKFALTASALTMLVAGIDRQRRLQKSVVRGLIVGDAGASPEFGDNVPTFEQALGQITTLQQENTVLRAQIE